MLNDATGAADIGLSEPAQPAKSILMAATTDRNPAFAPLFALSRAERLQLVQDLWDSIAQEDEPLPFPEWKHEELRRRKEKLLQNPSSGLTWEEVKRQVRAQDD